MINSNKKYEAQALAVAMVVLVVCTLLGVSIYSRVLRDKDLTIQEQSSAEALGIADLALDLILENDVDTESLDLNLGEETKLDILIEDVDPNPLLLCNSDSDKSLDIEVRYMNGEDIYELRNLETWGLDLTTVPNDGSCSAANFEITVSERGQSNVGYYIQYIYTDVDGTRKTFKEKDTVYCFSDDGSTCNNTNFTGDTTISADNILTIIPYEAYTSNAIDYTLQEIRITAIGGTVGISQTMSNDACFEDTNFISYTAYAQCSGASRAKQVLVPQNPWAKSIFDFTLYNGVGNLTSN